MHQNRPDPPVRREPFPLLRVLPLELHDVILEVHWDQALHLPAVRLQVAESIVNEVRPEGPGPLYSPRGLASRRIGRGA